MNVEPMTDEQTQRAVVDFCMPEERSWWQLIDRFEVSPLRRALRRALESGQLTRRQEADGFYFRATFPGVDIDRIHTRPAP